MGRRRPGQSLTPAADAQTISGIAAFTGAVVNVEDVPNDPRFRSLAAHRLGDYRAGIAVPMKRDGKVEGVISMSRPEARLFTERQVALVQTFADQAVIAIEQRPSVRRGAGAQRGSWPRRWSSRRRPRRAQGNQPVGVRSSGGPADAGGIPQYVWRGRTWARSHCARATPCAYGGLQSVTGTPCVRAGSSASIGARHVPGPRRAGSGDDPCGGRA